MTESYVPKATSDRVRNQAGHRCGYCLSPQRYVMGQLEIEHLVPKALGGSDEEENLWLSCRLCNGHKSVQIEAIDPETEAVVPLFDPRHDRWSNHFQWSNDGREVVGITPSGRATVEALKLNNLIAVTVRGEWVEAGWHPPKNAV